MAAVTTTGTKLQSHEPNWINTWFNATLSQVVVVVVVAGGGGGGGSAGWGDQGRYTLPPHSVYTERYVASTCLLYTSDAADDNSCVDLGGRRII